MQTLHVPQDRYIAVLITPNMWANSLRIAGCACEYCFRPAKSLNILYIHTRLIFLHFILRIIQIDALVGSLSTIYWPYPTLKLNGGEGSDVSD